MRPDISTLGITKLKELFREPAKDDQSMDFMMSPDWNNGYRAAINEVRPSMLALIRKLESPSSQWISVDDLLPEIGVDVLAYRPRAPDSRDPAVSVTRRGWMDKVNQSPQGVMHCFECWCHPTHWMPLPEPPL